PSHEDERHRESHRPRSQRVRHRAESNSMLYLALVTAVAVVGAFIEPLVLAYRQEGSPAHDAAPSAVHIAPRVIQNSSIVYRLGLVALAPLLAWGISGELWPLVAHL